jgi:hypothetical protein
VRVPNGDGRAANIVAKKLAITRNDPYADLCRNHFPSGIVSIPTGIPHGA